MAGRETRAVIGDKEYDSNRIVAHIWSERATVVISHKVQWRELWENGRELYRQRNLIENEH